MKRIHLTIQIDLTDEEIDNRQVHRTIPVNVFADVKTPRGVMIEGEGFSIFLLQHGVAKEAETLLAALSAALAELD